MRVSHETIYRSLFIQARGVLKKELMQHLRSKRSIRRSVHSRAGGRSHGQIVDAISISARPAEIEDRAIPGHWEGDLLSGTGNSHIATLVERHSRFTMLVKVPSKDTATVVAALSRHVRKLPASLRRSLTWDRGLEMAKHKSFTVATKVNVYFCDPQSPWQRDGGDSMLSAETGSIFCSFSLQEARLRTARLRRRGNHLGTSRLEIGSDSVMR
jgi:IS30 family transposase